MYYRISVENQILKSFLSVTVSKAFFITKKTDSFFGNFFVQFKTKALNYMLFYKEKLSYSESYRAISK